MATMIYIYVIPYCFSVGPVPCKCFVTSDGYMAYGLGVYCAEIFNNRTRAYGLMTASSSQW
jgi:hypothetical protein